MSPTRAGPPRPPASPSGAPVPGAGGFTILEVLFVTVLALLTLGIAAQSYAFYVERTAAQHAAKIFARDLSLARATAVQRRESVVVRFDEPNLTYEVETGSGVSVVERSHDRDSDAPLSSVDLEMSGDSVVFDARGVADLSGVGGSLAEASFQAGGTTYTVFFNSLGGSRVEGS